MLLFCQSIISQTSITFLFVLNYEFSVIFSFPFVFAIPFIPLSFPFPTIPDSILFPMIKCGYGNGREIFPSVFIPSSDNGGPSSRRRAAKSDVEQRPAAVAFASTHPSTEWPADHSMCSLASPLHLPRLEVGTR
jgi:hypothetical protein